VALTRLLGMLVRAVTRTRRRRVATLAVPALIVVAVVAPRAARDGTEPRGVLAGASTGTTAAGSTAAPSAMPATGLPDTTGAAPGPAVAVRPEPTLGAAPARVAAGYVRTANSHDARPGRDRGFVDSYVRARPYLTAQLYALVSAPSRRGDYLWAQWTAAEASVSVSVLRVAVPDGAPAPTATSAYIRVLFRQVVTPHVAGAGTATATATASVDAVSLVATRGSDGTWRVSRLLPDT
jgi:hypothetical protein